MEIAGRLDAGKDKRLEAVHIVLDKAGGGPQAFGKRAIEEGEDLSASRP
jgi:hypothetical protein